MTRLESGAIRLKTQLCDLRDLVGAALSQAGHDLESELASIDIPSDVPPAPVDSALITQALVNIFDNALRYSQHSPIEIGARREENAVRVSVADRGPGIAEAALPHVFEKFYSGSPREGGVGLGLSICKGFIEAHGGTIQARNRERGGAVITFTLPLHAAGGAG
jgi:two-component system, OmpR family, sensor histidine kinase KdpD